MKTFKSFLIKENSILLRQGGVVLALPVSNVWLMHQDIAVATLTLKMSLEWRFHVANMYSSDISYL